MGLEDRAKNKAQEMKGQAKEQVGKATPFRAPAEPMPALGPAVSGQILRPCGNKSNDMN
jgi:hypothetical protein